MNIIRLGYRIVQKIQSSFTFLVFQYPRIIKYNFLSGYKNIQGKPKLNQPVLFTGKGNFFFGKNVTLGVQASPFFIMDIYILMPERKNL